jgi:hypothetical protein
MKGLVLPAAREPLDGGTQESHQALLREVDPVPARLAGKHRDGMDQDEPRIGTRLPDRVRNRRAFPAEGSDADDDDVGQEPAQLAGQVPDLGEAPHDAEAGTPLQQLLHDPPQRHVAHHHDDTQRRHPNHAGTIGPARRTAYWGFDLGGEVI